MAGLSAAAAWDCSFLESSLWSTYHDYRMVVQDSGGLFLVRLVGFGFVLSFVMSLVGLLLISKLLFPPFLFVPFR